MTKQTISVSHSVITFKDLFIRTSICLACLNLIFFSLSCIFQEIKVAFVKSELWAYTPVPANSLTEWN